MLLPVTQSQHLKDIEELLTVLDGITMNEGQMTQLIYGLIKRIEALENQKATTVSRKKGDDYHGVEYG